MSYENLPWKPVPQVLDVFYKYNTKHQLQIENFLRLHCIFFLRMVFCLSRLNTFVFLPILGWKYSCECS